MLDCLKIEKKRKNGSPWLLNKGAEEAKAALAAIEEIEFAESEQKRAKDLAERRKAEERRQRRRQAWAQAIGTIVQAAGNAYMYSQGYTNNANLLNPNLAISQVQSQYSQLYNNFPCKIFKCLSLISNGLLLQHLQLIGAK